MDILQAIDANRAASSSSLTLDDDMGNARCSGSSRPLSWSLSPLERASPPKSVARSTAFIHGRLSGNQRQADEFTTPKLLYPAAVEGAPSKEELGETCAEEEVVPFVRLPSRPFQRQISAYSMVSSSASTQSGKSDIPLCLPPSGQQRRCTGAKEGIASKVGIVEKGKARADEVDEAVSSTDSFLALSLPPSQVYRTADPPILPRHLKSTLLVLSSCPICFDFWPTLKVDEEGRVVEARKVKRRKTAVKPKTVHGPARLTHMRMCTLRAQVTVDAVVSLVEREQVRVDKERRLAHIEEQQAEGMWKSVTGEAPPCTQIQTKVMQQRNAGRHSYYIDKTVREGLACQKRGQSIAAAKGNKQISPTKPGASRSRPGTRGGTNRASTTVERPQRRSESIKVLSERLFGSDQIQDRIEKRATLLASSSGSVFDRFDLSEDAYAMPFGHLLNEESKSRRGLGIGACAEPGQEAKSFSAEARLGMGYWFASGIRQRLEAQDR